MLAALVMVSSGGALTGIVLAGPRVYYSMAQDGLAPRWLGHIHPVHRTPAHAIVAQALWASVLAATGVYRQVFTRGIYTQWVVFALMAGGPFLLRRGPRHHPADPGGGGSDVPLGFLLGFAGLLDNPLRRRAPRAANG